MNCWSSEGKREVNYWFSEVDVRSELLAFGGKVGGELLVFGVKVGGELLVFGGKARSDGFESVCCWVVRFAARDGGRESAVFHSGPTSEGVCRAFPPIAFLLYGSESSG